MDFVCLNFHCFAFFFFKIYPTCLKVTNEQQDDGAGILHQVAQFPVDQVYLYTRCPCPSPPMQDPERQGAGCKASRPICLSEPPTPCSESQLKRVGSK